MKDPIPELEAVTISIVFGLAETIDQLNQIMTELDDS